MFFRYSVSIALPRVSGVEKTMPQLSQLKTTQPKGTLYMRVAVRVDPKGDGSATSAKARELSKSDSVHETDNDADQVLHGRAKSAARSAAVATKTRETADEAEAREYGRDPGPDKRSVSADDNYLLMIAEPIAERTKGKKAKLTVAR